MVSPAGHWAGKPKVGNKKTRKKSREQIRSAAAKFAAAQSRNPMINPHLLLTDPEYRSYVDDYAIDTRSLPGAAIDAASWVYGPKILSLIGRGAWGAVKGGYRAAKSGYSKLKGK